MIKVKKYLGGGSLYSPSDFNVGSSLPFGFGTFGKGPSKSPSKGSIFDQSSGSIPYQGLLTGGAAIAGGVADLIGSKKRIGEQEGLYHEAMRLRGQTRGKQDEFKFGVAQAQRDLATAGIRPTDTSYIQSGLATSLDSMNDPRQFGNLTGLLGQTLEAERKAKEGDLNRELGAMGNLADLEQQALSQNQAKDYSLLSQDSQEQFADATTAAQNKAQLEQDRRNAFGDIASGALEAGFSAFTGAKNGGRIKFEEGGKMSEDVMMRILEEQRPVQKTEGEFNHDTNKKAIIDEETGVKEGEATGGEYILNPEQGEAIKVQYDEIARIIEEGSEPSLEELQNLYDAVHEVFSQPQFNEA